jgi:endonuclease/exonuclease/phosphatase (EEP) superfamily protein YafD
MKVVFSAKRVYPWLGMALMGLVVLTFASLLGGRGFYTGLLTHFKLHYLLALVASLIIWTPARRWGWVSLGILALLLNFSDIVHLYRLPKDLQLSEPRIPLRLVSANLLRSNRQYQAIGRYLDAKQPDVVVLLETTLAMKQGLAPWLARYPYQRIETREGYFGLMVLSRYPIVESDLHFLCDADVPTIHATLDLHGKRVDLIATHPPAPPKVNEMLWRNQQLIGLADLAHNLSHPVILAGDLNLTSYHPFFNDLLRDSGLYDSRRGFGIQASWPVGLGPLGITLDHCLLSPSIGVVSRCTGPDIGSDHAPICLDMEISR